MSNAVIRSFVKQSATVNQVSIRLPSTNHIHVVDTEDVLRCFGRHVDYGQQSRVADQGVTTYSIEREGDRSACLYTQASSGPMNSFTNGES